MKNQIKKLIRIILLSTHIYSQYTCQNYPVKTTPIITSCLNPGVLPLKTLTDLGGLNFSQSKKITISGWWKISPNLNALNQFQSIFYLSSDTTNTIIPNGGESELEIDKRLLAFFIKSNGDNILSSKKNLSNVDISLPNFS